ncbi:acyltransferase [Microbacterium pumilum]|uniref:Acyltransferase 3 domain-containing protein n=1 Tax=Microbacterium pumilum TaxID=344165 RepID=A0ABN2S9J6_9MICO
MVTSSLTRQVSRKAWVDVAKGIAILLVVTYHASLYLAKSGGLLGMPWIMKAPLELFPMPAFFVLAGMLSARTLGFTFSDLWRRRVLPMLYLYAVWSVIRFIFYIVIPGANAEVGDLPANSPITLALIFLWPSSSYWFLYALALFTVAAWAIRRVPVAVQVAVTAVLCAVTTSGLLDTQNVGWNRVIGLFIFYVVGVHFAKQIFEGVARVRVWFLPIALVVFGGYVGALIFLGLRDVPGAALIGQLLAVVVGFSFAQLIAPLRVTAFLARWGSLSLYIYLYHLFLIVPVATIVGLIGWTGPRWAGFLVQAALTLAAIEFAVLMMKLTGRFKWLYLPPRSWVRSPVRPAAAAEPASAPRDESAPSAVPAPETAPAVPQTRKDRS